MCKARLTLLAASVLVVILAASPVGAVTLHVPGDFDFISDAIAAAGHSDTVVVHPGIYTGAGNRDLDFGGKNLNLIAPGGPEVTIIDCELLARGFDFHSGEDTAAVVHGFTIRNGSALRGGGIYCQMSSPTISGCVLELNTATEAGAGLYCFKADPVITACSFVGNVVLTSGYGHGGGGIQCNASSPVITECEFAENSASSGGGLYCIFGACPTVEACDFKENDAYAYHGGGLFCFDNSTPTLSQCRFIINTAARNGGGVYCENSPALFASCQFLANEAFGSITGFGGGGMCLLSSSPTLIDCDFGGNYASRGGGINCRGGSNPSIQGGAFWENTATDGGGVYCREASAPSLRGVSLELGSAASGGGLYADEAYPEMNDCIFAWNVATGVDYYSGGGAVHLYMSDALVDSCAFIDNSGVLGGAFHMRDCLSTSLSATTLVRNTADQGSAIYCCESSASVANSIVALGSGEAVTCVSGFVEFTCSDVFGNAGGDWVGCIASQLGYAGNICADPLFCDGGDIAENYTLQDGSPCAAANSPCGQMGRWGVGCSSTIVESHSWGGIKAMYR